MAILHEDGYENEGVLDRSTIIFDTVILGWPRKFVRHRHDVSLGYPQEDGYENASWRVENVPRVLAILQMDGHENCSERCRFLFDVTAIL
jgi:hypothetical protein